jgi:hypothetical protein
MAILRFGPVRLILRRCFGFRLQKRMDCALEAKKVQVCAAYSCLPVRTERLYRADDLVHTAAESNSDRRPWSLL